MLYRWTDGYAMAGTPYCARCRQVFIGAIVEGGVMA